MPCPGQMLGLNKQVACEPAGGQALLPFQTGDRGRSMAPCTFGEAWPFLAYHMCWDCQAGLLEAHPGHGGAYKAAKATICPFVIPVLPGPDRGRPQPQEEQEC